MVNPVRMVEPEPYGKKIDYDPLWTGPMNKERRSTDTRLIKCLAGYCVIWLGIAIYAYSSGSVHDWIRGNNIHHSLPSQYVDNYKASTIRDTLVISSSSVQSHNVFKPGSDGFYKISLIVLQFIAVSAILCAAFILLLRWFVKFIVYTVIVLAFTGMFCITCFAAFLASYEGGAVTALFIVSVLIFLVCLVLFIIHRKKIDIACEVIREASKCVLFFPSTLVFPLVPFFIFLGIIIITATVYASLVSISNLYEKTPNYISLFYLYNMFGFWWLGGFVLSFSQMVLSGTFATWYWTHNKFQVPKYALLHFADTTFKYHLGTLAFGSLILAICKLIKMILKAIKKSLQGRCSPFACCCFGWYQYLFENIERYVEYMNFNAYVMCAIHGTGFFESAKNAFNLLMRNIVKAFIINKMTHAILLLGQILTVIFTTLCAALYMGITNLKNDEINIVLPSVFVSSIIVSVFFFMVLRTAIDTIFLCVLEDYERNDGSEERPYFMSLELKTLFLEE